MPFVDALAHGVILRVREREGPGLSAFSVHRVDGGVNSGVGSARVGGEQPSPVFLFSSSCSSTLR